MNSWLSWNLVRAPHGPPSIGSLRVYEGRKHALLPVYKAAEAIGQTTTESNDWRILWSYRTPWQFDTLKRRRAGSLFPEEALSVPPAFLLNHLPATLSLASKAHLIAFAGALRDADPHSFGPGLLPESYLLPERMQTFSHALQARGAVDGVGFPRWIAKSKEHRGVRVLTNSSTAALAALGSALVQERVRPLILPGLGRSFDVGLYVLVTSVRPLRVWSFGLSLVRFCEGEYPRAPADFSVLSRYVIKEYTPIWKLPRFASALAACNQSAFCALRRELRNAGYDDAYLTRSMHKMATALIGALRPRMFAAFRRLRLRSDATFEVFRFDFMVDAWARAILTEVNISPNLVAAHPIDGEVKLRLLRDTLTIAKQRLLPTETLPQLRGVHCSEGCCKLASTVRAVGGGSIGVRRAGWSGRVVRWCGRVVRWCGRAASWSGRVVRWCGRLVRWCGRAVRWCGRVARWCGRVVWEVGML